MNNENHEISAVDLKNYFISQSSLINMNTKEADSIIIENGYDVEKIENDGLQFIHSLKVKINKEVDSKNVLTWKKLISNLSTIGISKNFIEEKVIPSGILKYIHQRESFELAIDYLSQVFNIAKDSLKSGEKTHLQIDQSYLTFYKKPVNSNINQIRAYSHYAQFIAKAVTKACKDIRVKEYPQNIEEFRLLIENQYGEINLNSILAAVWKLGICVLPLKDSGVFHGASLNINGRHVIILKQKARSHAKWIFDLLHELYHVFVHLEGLNSVIIEEKELSPILSNDSEEEMEANTFANKVVFGDRAEYLAKKCVDMANGKMERLKSSVQKISQEENVRADLLANYLAHRLDFDGKNWWGTANSLQVTSPSPYEITQNYLLEKINYNYLNTIENNMLSKAIN